MQERLHNVCDDILDYFLELDEKSAKFMAWKYVPILSVLTGSIFYTVSVNKRIDLWLKLQDISTSNIAKMCNVLICAAASGYAIYTWHQVLYYKKHKIDDVNKSNERLWAKYGDPILMMQYLYSELGENGDFVFLPIYYAKNGLSKGSFIRANGLNQNLGQEYVSCRMSSSDLEQVRQYFDTAYQVLPDDKYNDLLNKILKHLHKKLNNGAMYGHDDRYFYARMLYHKITTMECKKVERVNLLDWFKNSMSNLRAPIVIEDVSQVSTESLAEQLTLAKLQYTKADWKKMYVGCAPFYVVDHVAGLKVQDEDILSMMQ